MNFPVQVHLDNRELDFSVRSESSASSSKVVHHFTFFQSGCCKLSEIASQFVSQIGTNASFNNRSFHLFLYSFRVSSFHNMSKLLLNLCVLCMSFCISYLSSRSCNDHHDDHHKRQFNGNYFLELIIELIYCLLLSIGWRRGR